MLLVGKGRFDRFASKHSAGVSAKKLRQALVSSVSLLATAAVVPKRFSEASYAQHARL